ncbi:MAG: response regulator transcription factor [Acidimicrobiales bacterium]
MSVLVIEDYAPMTLVLTRHLTEEGYAVDTAATGQEGVWQATARTLEAIVLDVGLPDIDGFEVCRRIRATGQWAPILMLTARDGVSDRVRGLDAGADDYLPKPFAIAELAARLRSLIRRGQVERPTVLAADDVTLDPATRQVRRRGTLVELTAKEFALLEVLMRHPGQVVSRATIRDHAWDWSHEERSNVLDVHIRSLRAKLDKPFGARTITTCRGAGFRFEVGRGTP